MRRSKGVKMAKKSLNKANGEKKKQASLSYLSVLDSYKNYRREKLCQG